MRRAQGYLVIVDPYAAKPLEHDTFTCHHCNVVVVVELKADPDKLGGFCRLCMKQICPTCLNGNCTPFEKKLEAIEARDRLTRAIGV